MGYLGSRQALDDLGFRGLVFRFSGFNVFCFFFVGLGLGLIRMGALQRSPGSKKGLRLDGFALKALTYQILVLANTSMDASSPDAISPSPQHFLNP